MNNIYLLSMEYAGYDTYDSKVIVASSEDEAREIANYNTGDEGKVWKDPSVVKCEVVDTSTKGAVCESFNAG